MPSTNDLFQSFIKKPYSNVRVPNTVLRAMETQARSLLDRGLKGHERRAMQGIIDRIAQSRAEERSLIASTYRVS